MSSAAVLNRAINFGVDRVWSRCPMCGHRHNLGYDELYGQEVLCARCELPVKPGSWQLDVADVDDVALSAEKTHTVSWFHTSTHRVWPPPEAAARDRAIHLGTYEAAIDSMWSRMANQNEAHCRFYLHRITLPDGIAVNPELGEDRGELFTGFVDLSLVTAGGYTAYRYLNQCEHRGSISLAVDPAVITAVQTIGLPPPALTVPIAPAAVAAVTEYDDECAAAGATLTESDRNDPPTSLDALLGRTEKGRRVAERESRVLSARQQLYAKLDEAYLSGVGPQHRELFQEAIKSMTASSTPASVRHGHYRTHSAALLFADASVRLLSAEPVRRPALFAAGSHPTS